MAMIECAEITDGHGQKTTIYSQSNALAPSLAPAVCIAEARPVTILANYNSATDMQYLAMIGRSKN